MSTRAARTPTARILTKAGGVAAMTVRAVRQSVPRSREWSLGLQIPPLRQPGLLAARHMAVLRKL